MMLLDTQHAEYGTMITAEVIYEEAKQLKDDVQQTREATDFLAANQCMILQTVLLEMV